MHWLWPWTFYFSLDSSGEIEFWVAVGTIGLALVTVTSLFQNRRLLRAEELRHQQRLAPILCLQKHEDYVGTNIPNVIASLFVLGLCVTNRGIGPALDVSVRFNVKYNGQVMPYTDNLAVVVGPGEQVEIAASRILGRAVPGFVPKDLEVTEVELSYSDLFHNCFQTQYDDLRKGNYTWIAPWGRRPREV